MSTSVLLLLLSAGVPYYLILERIKKIGSKYIFILSGLLLLSAVVISSYTGHDHPSSLVIISLLSAIFSVYKATKTTNFYKLGYYLIFVNAPFFMLFEDKAPLYSLSLLISLVGLYLVAKYYEKNYGSANYHHITGITLSTPCIGTYLTFYLIALSLYPPFPNSVFFLSYIFKSDPNLLWFTVVITLFFANFFLAMRVMKKTLFGRPNPKIHYVHMTVKEKSVHLFIVIALLIFSAYGIKETLI